MARQMKNSGIEWIGEIPQNWTTARNKTLFQEINETCDGTEGYDLLSVSEYYGVAKRVDKIADGEILIRAENLSGYKICQKDDIVMNIMLAWKSSLGASSYEGIVSPAYCVYRGKKPINAKYYHYLFRTKTYADLFKQYSTGIIDSRLRLYPDKFFALYSHVPPLSEQQKIADFLDKQCAEIDTVIAKTRATIEEYKKLKQSIITEAVTKGVRGDRPMKDSDIEWIGDIPADWSVSRIKYVSDFEPSTDKSGLTEESIITYTPMDCIKNGWFINQTAPLGSVSTSLSAYQDGDIVIAKVTPCFENGNIAIMENLSSGYGLGSSELFVLRAKSIVTKYLFYWLRNDNFVQSACSTMTGTGGLKRVSPTFVKDCYLHLPPKEEQVEIAEYLDRKCAEMDTLIEKKTALLEEMETYKKSVIYEYVTGKKEV